MTCFLKSVVVVTTFTLLIASAALAGGYRHGNCGASVEAELDRLDVNRSDIASITYSRRTRSESENDVTDGYDAWVRFKSCKGALIVPMRTSCRVKTPYTRGDCSINGVKNY